MNKLYRSVIEKGFPIHIDFLVKSIYCLGLTMKNEYANCCLRIFWTLGSMEVTPELQIQVPLIN